VITASIQSQSKFKTAGKQYRLIKLKDGMLDTRQSYLLPSIIQTVCNDPDIYYYKLIYTTNAKADVIADKFASHFISAFSCNDPQKANSVKQDYVCMRDCGLPLCTPCFTGPRVHTTQPKRHRLVHPVQSRLSSDMRGHVLSPKLPLRLPQSRHSSNI